MSQHRGVLEWGHGHDHAVGGHLHTGLQVLRGKDVAKAARAGPLRAVSHGRGRGDVYGSCLPIRFQFTKLLVFPLCLPSSRWCVK